MATASKREGELKSLFGEELKRQAPGFLVLQYATNGAPDRSVVGNGRQTNWEAKHATPDFRSPGDQELMCCRLAVQGHCRYVIWLELPARCKDCGATSMSTTCNVSGFACIPSESIKKTVIAHPSEVFQKQGKGRFIRPIEWCVGFDMRWLVAQVLKEHGA